MLMNNRIFWLVIILSVLTIGFSSCAKDTRWLIRMPTGRKEMSILLIQ